MLVVPVKMTKEEESKTSEMTLSDFRSLKWKSQNKVVTRHSWMFWICSSVEMNWGTRESTVFVWGFEKCNNFSICRQIKISQKYFYPQTYLPTETFDLVSKRKWGIRSYSALLDSLTIEDPTSSYRIPCQVPLLAIKLRQKIKKSWRRKSC